MEREQGSKGKRNRKRRQRESERREREMEGRREWGARRRKTEIKGNPRVKGREGKDMQQKQKKRRRDKMVE